VLVGAFALYAPAAAAQAPSDTVIRVNLPPGRSYPITTADPITRVSVATPEIADAVVVGDRDLVINAKAAGETDVIVWISNEPRRHYRFVVSSAPDRKAVLLNVRIAEVRKDVETELGVNALYRDKNGHVRAGTGIFNTDNVFDKLTGDVILAHSKGTPVSRRRNPCLTRIPRTAINLRTRIIQRYRIFLPVPIVERS